MEPRYRGVQSLPVAWATLLVRLKLQCCQMLLGIVGRPRSSVCTVRPSNAGPLPACHKCEVSREFQPYLTRESRDQAGAWLLTLLNPHLMLYEPHHSGQLCLVGLFAFYFIFAFIEQLLPGSRLSNRAYVSCPNCSVVHGVSSYTGRLNCQLIKIK
jgi:hypothetical protein